jgi:hypothetical protein
MSSSRLAAVLGVAAVTCAFAADPAAPRTGREAPTARASSHVASLARLFADRVFLGGQVPPRQYRWVNRDASIFVQFDRPNPQEARAVRYLGIGVRGTFCAETQPRGPRGGFTHFHRLTAPVYAQGHGGPPGSEGYWLLWVAADEFESFDRRQVRPGVDYEFSPTPAPACGRSPKPTFQAPGAHDLSRAEIRRLARFFHDQPLLGGQTAPRLYRWVNADTAIFLEFDHADPRRARRLRYVGVAKRGRFTAADQGTRDFASFQRLRARTFRTGLGGRSGTVGLWHLAVGVDRFRMRWGQVPPGVDRRFYRTAVPKA